MNRVDVMELSMIVAMAKGRAIGRDGGLLCHMPADMRHFKSVTTGHTVVMGRRTFDSLPKGALPDRRNIVVTRNLGFTADRVEVAHSLDEALALAEGDGEVFVIGGAQIYSEALPFAKRLYLTEIDAEIMRDEWEEVSCEKHPADDRNPYPFTFVTLRRI